MATLDWSQCPAVESVPGKVSGAWVFAAPACPYPLCLRTLNRAPASRRFQSGFTSRGSRWQPCLNSQRAASTRQPRLPRHRRFRTTHPLRRLPMLVLFDQSTPAPLRPYLKAHTVTEARDRGWDRLANGDLLNAAEAAGFQVFVTADKNLRYRQNLAGRQLQPGHLFRHAHLPVISRVSSSPCPQTTRASPRA